MWGFYFFLKKITVSNTKCFQVFYLLAIRDIKVIKININASKDEARK